jgi:hypothetical protein
VIYSKPEFDVMGPAIAAIQNPNSNPKLFDQILDSISSDITKTHTPSAYAADE